MSITYAQARYRGRVVSQALSETGTGNTQFVLTFDILGVYDPTQPEGLLQTTPGQRSVFRVITEKTIEYFLEDLKYLGFDKGTFGALDPASPNHHSFVGQEIDALCSHEEYEGKMKERWQLSRGGGGLNLKPVDSKAVRSLDALFGAKLKANAAPSAKKPATQQKAAPATEEAEKEFVPF